MTELVVGVGPLVQVVPGEGRGDPQTFPWSDIALDGDDPATISDRDIATRVARWMDRDESEFTDMVITRPETGNILLSPKAVYG